MMRDTAIGVRRRRSLCLICLLLGTLSPGCSKQTPTDRINLSELEPLPDESPDAVVAVRLAVANMVSPQGTAESYGALVEYLSQKLGRPVELIHGRSYAETNDLVRRGEVDVAFVCTMAYVIGHDEFGIEPLVAPRVGGKVDYHSVLIVPRDSPAESMADLEGATFAFTDPMSNTGRFYPHYLVQQLGGVPETFFSSTFYTYSHDDAIRSVSQGLADGAAVDNLVLGFALFRDPELDERIRVIHRSPPFGTPPVVVSPRIRPQLRVQLEDVFLNMVEDPAGSEALAGLDIDEFVVVEDDAYQSVRELLRTVQREIE
jgi:phosphonate transport system substrate-binding protein